MKKNLIWAVTAALMLTLCGRFLAPCIEYNSLSEAIREAEVQGDSEYYDETARCLMPNWCRDGYTEKYNAAVEAKKAFIEENDVAKWISTSADTLTGSVVRLLVIAEAMALFAFALVRLIHSVWLIGKKAFRKSRRRNRRQTKKQRFN